MRVKTRSASGCAAGQDEAESPAAVQRVRTAALACLRRAAAACEAVVAPTVSAMLPAVGDLLAEGQPALVREQATQALMALAAVDADAAWALLAGALQANGAGILPAALAKPPAVAGVCRFPQLRLAQQPGRGRRGGHSGLARCGVPKLQAMLQQVEELPPRWHSTVAQLA